MAHAPMRTLCELTSRPPVIALLRSLAREGIVQTDLVPRHIRLPYAPRRLGWGWSADQLDRTGGVRLRMIDLESTLVSDDPNAIRAGLRAACGGLGLPDYVWD